jgi:acid phosphatase type 7
MHLPGGSARPSVPIWRAMLGSLLLMVGSLSPSQLPGPASGQTRAATTTLTFPAEADTYASSRRLTRNFGLGPALRTDAKPHVRSFIRFDLGGIDAHVSRAVLRVFAGSTNQSGIDVRGVATNSWHESTLTYLNSPRVSRPVDSSGPVRAGRWAEWDVTLLLRSTGRVSFALTSSSMTATRLSSRESSNPPQLIVSTSIQRGPEPERGFVVMGAGDIACEPPSVPTASACREFSTSELLVSADLVLTFGDNQYEDGALLKFLGSYDRSWGRFKEKTRPAVGNHDYLTRAAAGYFDYFGSLAGEPGKGYYSFDAGGWHFVALNSECTDVGGCGPGSPQYEWLRADLEASTARCSAAYWHHPRFSAGQYHDDASYEPFWDLLYADGAEVVMAGHDHNYQRYAPMTPGGARDDLHGIRQFVVGTGGSNLYAVDTSAVPNRDVADDSTFGVLKLTLRSDGYDWAFVPAEGGTFTDAGSGVCH